MVPELLKVVSYIRRPTAAETTRHMVLAQRVMGWPETARTMDTTREDVRAMVVNDAQQGCLVGRAEPFRSFQVATPLYVRSYAPWAPSVDPVASAELRERLEALGWAYSLSAWQGEFPYLCTLTPDKPLQLVQGGGGWPEEALVMAALMVAARLNLPLPEPAGI